uniref:Ig-like domain-containing protein n=1 Tax=Sinocyclocheilus rhinocerous TaxID=307959 RepID=A0A673KIP8_9TELE
MTAEPLSSLPADDPPGSQGASYLQQPPKAKAVEGEDVVLPCFLKSDVDEVQAVEKVRWYVQSLEGRKNVLQGNETAEEEFAGRVFLSGDLSEGDLSMTLRNISVEDQGLYLCAFISTRSTVLQGGGTKLSIRKGLVCGHYNWHRCGSCWRGSGAGCCDTDSVQGQTELPAEMRHERQLWSLEVKSAVRLR